MKVVLSTVGRFHIFALARELQALGHLSRIYTGFPWFAVKREGVDRARVTTFPHIRPLLMGSRFLPWQPSPSMLDYIHQLSLVAQDAYVSGVLEDCDVFVGHEGVGLGSGRKAQGRGAVYVCDRGCPHVEWAYDLLLQESERIGLRPPRVPRTLAREAAEYVAADLVTVPSTYAAKTMEAKGIHRSKVVVAPYGAHIGLFHPSEQTPDDNADILFVGQFIPRKGIADLLAAFSRLTMPNKRLLIAGPMPKDVAERFASELSQPDVVCLGPLSPSRVAEVMRQSLVLVLPSIDEGFGLVLSEALACGCPIIATDHTGAPDLIEHDKEGFIIPIRSPERIAECIELLWRDRDRRIEMGRAGRRRVETLGGWASYAGILVDAYAGALAAKAGGG